MAGDPIAIAALIGCALTQAPAIALDEVALRVRDVASLDCLAPAQRQAVGEFVIAHLAPNERRLLSRQALANLVRRRVPSLSALSRSGADHHTVEISGPALEALGDPSSCYVAATFIAEGAAILAGDLNTTSCADAPRRAPVRYDRRHGIARASHDIMEGDALGRLAPAPTAIAESRRAVTLVTRIGPVTVERSVETVQPSAGGAVFVRDRDGRVFAAPLSEGDTP